MGCVVLAEVADLLRYVGKEGVQCSQTGELHVDDIREKVIGDIHHLCDRSLRLGLDGLCERPLVLSCQSRFTCGGYLKGWRCCKSPFTATTLTLSSGEFSAEYVNKLVDYLSIKTLEYK